MVALEHLVDDDPEALVQRRLARDPEDARELVLQRARPVRVDVRRAEQQPLAAARQERLERRLARCARSRAERPRASRSALRTSSSSGLDSSISRCSDARALREHRADLRERLGDALWPVAALRSTAASLTQLEVAHDAVGDLDVGVQAQLDERPADARDVAQQLVAQLAERRVQRLVGAEQLLAAVAPTPRRWRPRILGERRGRLQRAALGARA